MPAGLSPGAVYGLVKELRIAADEQGPLVVDGARGLAESLRRDLARGAAPGAVRGGPLPERADALVYVLAAPPTEEDERVLRSAHRRGIPIVAVLAGPELEPSVPYVLATDVVRVAAGRGFPVEGIARVLAARLGEEGTSLAARVPVLRRPLAEHLVETFARRHGLVGGAVFRGTAAFPVITLGQIRMVLRVAAAYGVEIDGARVPEVLAVVAGGTGMRRLARRLLALPLPGFLVRALVAYAGTRALGEAALRYFAAQASRAAA